MAVRVPDESIVSGAPDGIRGLLEALLGSQPKDQITSLFEDAAFNAPVMGMAKAPLKLIQGSKGSIERGAGKFDTLQALIDLIRGEKKTAVKRMGAIDDEAERRFVSGFGKEEGKLREEFKALEDLLVRLAKEDRALQRTQQSSLLDKVRRTPADKMP